MELVLYLPWPPTVNSYWSHTKRGVFLSKKGRIYAEEAAQRIHEQNGCLQLDDKLLVEVELYPPDIRTRDLDNHMKGLLDACTKAQVWIDDSQVDQLFIYRGKVLKNGLAIVKISEAGPLLPSKTHAQG
jgi:crossover junction endodeoxyribonuclease RusA